MRKLGGLQRRLAWKFTIIFILLIFPSLSLSLSVSSFLWRKALLSRKGFCRYPRGIFQTKSWVNFAFFLVAFPAFFLGKKQEEKSTQKSTAKFKSEFGSFAAKIHSARIWLWEICYENFMPISVSFHRRASRSWGVSDRSGAFLFLPCSHNHAVWNVWKHMEKGSPKRENCSHCHFYVPRLCAKALWEFRKEIWDQNSGWCQTLGHKGIDCERGQCRGGSAGHSALGGSTDNWWPLFCLSLSLSLALSFSLFLSLSFFPSLSICTYIYICRRVIGLSTFWPFWKLIGCPPFCQNLIFTAGRSILKVNGLST